MNVLNIYLPQNPEFLEGATVLSYVIDAKSETFSGGQKKRVAVARTLINPTDKKMVGFF